MEKVCREVPAHRKKGGRSSSASPVETAERIKTGWVKTAKGGLNTEVGARDREGGSHT